MSEREVESMFAFLSSRPENHRYNLSRLVKSRSALRCFIRLMCQTGLCISDAIQFDSTLMRFNEREQQWVYDIEQIKTGCRVLALLDQAMVDEIQACEWMDERYPFWPKDQDPKAVAESVQTFCKDVMTPALGFRVHPNRLRDNFAVRSLNDGVPMETVSRLLGHKSVSTAEKHYSRWIADREDALIDLVRAARARKAERAKLAVVPKRAVRSAAGLTAHQ